MIGSFRDPEGYCLVRRDEVLRFVRPDAAERVLALLASDFFKRLEQSHRVPRTEVLDASPHVPGASANEGGAGSLRLRHEVVPFVTYPHEWCPAMFHAAGNFTLDLQLKALREGYTLKDATPFNVLFVGARPIFVDVLSFSNREEGSYAWIAYAQFIRCFLLPLILFREQGVGPHEAFWPRRDGLEPDEVYSRLSFASRMKPLALQHVSLPTWLGHRKAQTAPRAARRFDESRALLVSQMLVQSLKNGFCRLKPDARASRWSNYTEESNYDRTTFAAKEHFLAEALAATNPKSVLDVGCNTGHFSRMAARSGAFVVSIDTDLAVLDSLFQTARAEGLAITPLRVDMARPSPALGWRNTETASFLERAEERFDMVLLLAVLHHLAITDGIPLPELFELFARIATRTVVAEFVPPTDSMFQRLIANKEHLIPKLSRNAFEKAFAPWFESIAVQPAPEGGRILYHLLKRAE